MELTKASAESLSKTTTMNCKNCSQTVSTNYCGHCGAPVVLKRVDKHYILHEIQHVLHFEKGILYTVKELLIRPGQNIRVFLNENRSRLVKPIIFIIITSLFYSIIEHLFHLEKGYATSPMAANSAYVAILGWVENHYGYANLIMGAVVALWLKVICRKSGYNYFEFIIMLCFVMGISMLLFAFFALIQGVTGIKLDIVGGTVPVIYCMWAIGQFLDGKKVSSYVRAIVAYLLGMFTFTFSAIILAVLIELIHKK